MKRSAWIFARSVGALVTGLLVVAPVTACKDYRSYWVNVTVVNQIGAPVRDVEVDYPSAGFGINLMATGGVYHYRLKVNGSGKVRVLYPGAMDKPIHLDGPELRENEQGELTITLLPDAKARFDEHLSMGR